ncbi:MAG: serine hydrolase domain-containing protein [Lysobacterales bacterium]
MLKNFSLMHLALAWVVVLLGFGSVPIARAELQKNLEESLAAQGLTGVAWALIGEGGEVTTGAAGLRDSFTQSRFGAATRFHVGSLTKAVLATGVLRLATQGRIDLDAPIETYLPDLSIYNPWSKTAKVTSRHLLDHTAGLSDAQMWQMFSERADPDAPLIAAFPDPQVQLRVRSVPGSQMSYSNSGYTLLGMVIEAVVGDRYEAYLDAHLLTPLGMHGSTFHYTSQSGAGADATLAWGHVDGGERYGASPIFLRPAGQFTTTSMDLSVFAQFLMSDGVINDEVFIDKALMQSRGMAQGTDAFANGLMAGYALGLGRRDRHGVVGFCHGGNIVGFVARLCVFPGQRKAYAYSVNTDSETANYGDIDALLIEALVLKGAKTPQSIVQAPDGALWEGRYIPSPNRFQSFEYLDRVFGATRVSASEGVLTLKSLQRSTRQLRPVGQVGQGLYSANDRSTTSHVFYQVADGQAFFSDGFQTFEKTSDGRHFAHWISLSAGLLGLVWIVLAGGVSVIFGRKKAARRVVVPAFAAAVLLFVPIPLFLTQSFMALGDVTAASTLLAVATFLLPLGMALTLVRAYKVSPVSLVNRLHLIAAAMVLQWCGVLVSAGLLPLRLWA